MSDKPNPAWLARNGGKQLEEQGAQLGFFGESGEPIAPVDAKRGAGRPAGAGNKLKSKIKDYLAAKGYRDPAEQLAMLAGLDQRELHPMAYAAQVAQLLAVPVTDVIREMRQASAELMPYWHAKLTPDVSVTAPSVNILMQGAGGVITMDSGQGGLDPFAPLDVRAGLDVESVEYQQVNEGDDASRVSSPRIEGLSD